VTYYGNRESLGVWGALVACFGVIAVGASIASHSLAVTSGLVIGTLLIWYLGYWALAGSRYFISSTAVGFKDRFRSQEVRFEEIRAVSRHARSKSSDLVFTCDTRTVNIPLDPIDDTWFFAVQAELAKRDIMVSGFAFGIKLKAE
jgi:hypothetical protein